MQQEIKTDGIAALLTTIKKLRSPGGCPWDAKQTPESLKKYLFEECNELAEAIDSKDRPHICEELGDLLLQIVLLSQIYSEEGKFDFDDVAVGINEKMIRRHPHVFEKRTNLTEEELYAQWDRIKQEEKGE